MSTSGKLDWSQSTSLFKTTRISVQQPTQKNERGEKREMYLVALFAPSQFLCVSLILTCQSHHLVGILLPLALTTCKHRSSAMRAMTHSPLFLAASKLRMWASSSKVHACICVTCILAGSIDAASMLRSVESAAVVCAKASWQHARYRSVFGGEVAAPIDGCNWRETACWQSVRAGRKCLRVM